MPKLIDFTDVPDGRHSFLYWLVIPFLLTWFATGYLFGHLTDKPEWLKTDSPSGFDKSVTPQFTPFAALPKTKSGYVSLWFDDAWLSQYLVAFPLLQKYNFPGVIAVPSSAIEQSGYVNWAQLQTMQKSGWEITNHSVSHNCSMNTWTAEQVNREYQASKLALWKHQLASDILVTPCGVDSQIMRTEAAKVFIAYRTVNPGQNDLTNLDPFNLRVRNIDNKTTLDEIKGWIDQANQPHQWVILVFHLLGTANEPVSSDTYNLDPSALPAILDYIKSSGLPVVTPGQIIAAYAV
jgi:peptidoglycan/xylan/chitin deacetylase (PgdA/CDA1 family)